MKPGNLKHTQQMVKKLESEPLISREREERKQIVPTIHQIAENR